ncbi:MAG: 1,6-anhydro-N-acetylmuramyl-L-alanine amidase AmpD [Gammaproteobacteria bacterium]
MTSFILDPRSGLLPSVLFRPSPNCDARPSGTTIDLLVIHGISLPPGEFGSNAIDALFLNRLDSAAHPYFQQIAHLRVSTHLLIRRDGQVIQYVPFTKRAWHAGISQYDGRQQCNDFSIGIELEGTDDIPYETRQYQQLAALTHTLMQVYPDIQPDRIVGHSDIAPNRKTDPGAAFNWFYYRQLLAEET